jgi:hypothetical protein
MNKFFKLHSNNITVYTELIIQLNYLIGSNLIKD